jgi:hypothetical protein
VGDLRPQSAQEGTGTFRDGRSPARAIENILRMLQHDGMRVNLNTRSAGRSASLAGTIPLILTIRPACGLPGDYECEIDGVALLQMLRQETDLSGFVLDDFEEKLCRLSNASLRGVEMSESALTHIGYFVD